MSGDFDSIVKNLSPGDHFAQITRTFCQDHSIRIATRSMLLDLFSRPSDWNVSVSGIMATMKMGRDQVRAALKEAEAAGYAYAHRARSERGRVAPPVWYISSSKAMLRSLVRQLESVIEHDFSPGPENQALVEKSQNDQRLKSSNWSPGPENQSPYSIKSTNTKDRQTDSSEIAETAKAVGRSVDETKPKGSPRQTRLALTDGEQKIARAAQADQEKINEKRAEEEAAFSAYNAAAEEMGFEPVGRLTPKWRNKLRLILDMMGRWGSGKGEQRLGAAGFDRALAKAKASPLWRGKVSIFRMTIDNLLNEDLLTSLLSGAHDARASPAVKPVSEAAVRKRWESRMKVWDDRGRHLWPTTDWGPAPGQPDCGVPADLLAKYSVSAAA